MSERLGDGAGRSDAPPPPQQPQRQTGRATARRLPLLLLLGAAVVVLVATVSLCAAFSLFIVSSPSMGRAAPVGTLVVSERLGTEAPEVGDVVTYRPKGSSTTITHRVVRVLSDGVVTRGDINGAADAVLVDPSMLVGRAVLLLPGAGWVVRSAPWIAIGLASVWLLTWPLRNHELCAGARLVGGAAVVSSIVTLQRPLTGWSVLSQTPVDAGMLTRLVSTGLLPIRIVPGGASPVTLIPGAVRDLLLPADLHGRVAFSATLGLEPWGWGLLALVCLSPLLAVLLFGLPARASMAEVVR